MNFWKLFEAIRLWTEGLGGPHGCALHLSKLQRASRGERKSLVASRVVLPYGFKRSEILKARICSNEFQHFFCFFCILKFLNSEHHEYTSTLFSSPHGMCAWFVQVFDIKLSFDRVLGSFEAACSRRAAGKPTRPQHARSRCAARAHLKRLYEF